MSPHGPIPTPETGRYLLQRALDKVGSRHQLARRLGIEPQDLVRYLDADVAIPAKIFTQCVDILYESSGEAVAKVPPAKRNP
jgi:hypothetical protein